MDFQLITTYLIVMCAIGYSLYQFALLFKKQESNCGSSCGSCNFKNELRKRGIPNKGIKNTHNLTYIKN
jgi:hypothetical protein